MITFATMIHESARFLERNYRCNKHHVIHTGSNAYLLDFYSFLGEVENGKKLVFTLLDLVVKTNEGGYVFYPGHINPMNMSQNVIDTGTAVDAISRFVRIHRDAFSKEEHAKIQKVLSKVVMTYLAGAAQDKKITNQRLWGLTGVASYARYVGEEKKYQEVVRKSVEKAFSDMTPDGYFIYFPDPQEHSLPYADITTFYQSRHTAFIEYAKKEVGVEGYEGEVGKSIEALLSMYRSDGTKDMRMECKRWYWLSSYEVASHGFDAYALACAKDPRAEVALHNVLYQIKRHFYGGHFHSHRGINTNFQCPIFWTAHLAWLTRIEGIEEKFDAVHELLPFVYTLEGKEIYTSVTSDGARTLLSTRFGERNPTTGIYHNGAPKKVYWSLKFPELPHAYLFSLRETANHTWYALRGFRIFEAVERAVRFCWNSLLAVLPRYTTQYGKITSIEYGETVSVCVIPGSRFGTLLDTEITLEIEGGK